MTSKQTGVYDFTVTVAGCPASTDEYDEMAKQVGACLDTAVDNDIQHIWKGQYRKALRKALEEASIPANEGETDGEHYKRAKALCANGTGPLDLEAFAALRQEVATKVDYSTGGGSSSRIGETWLTKAAKYLESVQDPGSWSAFCETITANNPGFIFDFGDDGVTPTQESCAMALKTENARVLAQAEVGLFGG